jgi:hypothetical protein
MTSESYLVLNSWLQKSDQNYIDGRFLWLNKRINSACNLLWLSLEQMIKILLVQSEIDEMLKGSTNLEESHGIVDLKCKKLGHRIKELLLGLNKKYSDSDVFRFENQLEKLNEYFFRRYVVHGGASIAVTMICDIDELYFAIRDKVDPDVGVGIIDSVFIQRKYSLGHPYSVFEYAYLHNKYFRTRKHKEIRFALFDDMNRVFVENGT